MKIDKELFQALSAHYMDRFGFPPLTASIFAYFLFDIEQKGYTFDEIREAMKASKSSVSNSLNLLAQANYIETINKIGERRRYYRVHQSFFTTQIKGIVSNLKSQKSILFRYEHFLNQNEHSASIRKKVNIHIDTLEKTIALYQEMIQSLENINKIDNLDS